MADRDTADRFVGGINLIITRDERGNIIKPPPGPERELALRREKAWRDFDTTGDDAGLIELGIFPTPEEEAEVSSE